MDERVINIRATAQKLEMDPSALKFQVPFAMSISGPSQSGNKLLTCLQNTYLLIIEFLC